MSTAWATSRTSHRLRTDCTHIRVYLLLFFFSSLFVSFSLPFPIIYLIYILSVHMYKKKKEKGKHGSESRTDGFLRFVASPCMCTVPSAPMHSPARLPFAQKHRWLLPENIVGRLRYLVVFERPESDPDAISDAGNRFCSKSFAAEFTAELHLRQRLLPLPS